MERHPVLAASCINLILFLGVYRLWTPHFVTNDDPAMMMLATGVSVVPQATAYLTFSHVLIGKALKIAYALLPGCPWYGLYMAGGVWLAHTVLLYVLMRRHGGGLGLLAFGAYTVLVGVLLLLYLQFTITACLTAFAGLLLWLPEEDGAGTAALPRRRLGRDVLAVVLVATGGMIRWQAFEMAVAIFLPFGALEWASQPKGRRVARAVWLGAALLAAAGLHAADGALRLRDAGWRQFGTDDPLICRFVDDLVLDHKSDQELGPILSRAGWSRNDWELFSSWLWMDPTVYSTDKMRAVLSSLPRFKELDGDGLREWALTLLWSPGVFGALCLYLLAVCLVPDRRARARWGVAAGTVALLLVYLLLVRRPAPRWVYIPMFACAAWIPLMWKGLGGHLARGPGRWRTAVLAGTLLLCLLHAARVITHCRRASAEYVCRDRRLEELVGKMHPRSDRLYVVQGAAFPWGWVLPFGDLGHLRTFRTLNLWADQTAPTARMMLDAFGIDNLYLALVSREDVLLITRSSSFLRAYACFMREHYGMTVEAVPVSDFGRFQVYRFRAR